MVTWSLQAFQEASHLLWKNTLWLNNRERERKKRKLVPILLPVARVTRWGFKKLIRMGGCESNCTGWSLPALVGPEGCAATNRAPWLSAGDASTCNSCSVRLRSATQRCTCSACPIKCAPDVTGGTGTARCPTMRFTLASNSSGRKCGL